ncbi:helix-turn-helix transcriptional regulator [Mycobacterium tuberculosis]|nr:helix-turn-helix transcriptional regulator [Mycobacterium tuberculosis]
MSDYGASEPPSVKVRLFRELRNETQRVFGKHLGISHSKVSEIEAGSRPISPNVALKIEELSNRRINASELNETIAAARRGVLHIDTGSDAGSWKKAILHSPNMDVADYRPDADRVVVCAVCDETFAPGCPNSDCPHVGAGSVGVAA